MKGLKEAYLLYKTLTSASVLLKKSRNGTKVTNFLGGSPKILLFGYMGLGDALMFQPSLKAIIRAFPSAKIDLLVGRESQSRAVLERIISMENQRFHAIFEADYKSVSLSELKQLNRKLVGEKYDIIICTYMSPSPYFTSAILSAPLRVGHTLSPSHWYKPRPNWLFNISVQLAQDHEHETSRHFRLIQKLVGTDGTVDSPHLILSDEEEIFAKTYWKEHTLEGRVVIGTHFGASKLQHWKKWDDDRFAKVLLDLQNKYNPIFLHFGVASEISQIEEASSFVRSSSINLAGKLSLFEVAALLKRCNAMLANDSGLGHVAMAVGTPTLRVFGMSDYWGYRSLSMNNIDIFKGISCSPCLQLGYLKPYNVHNCGHKNCMKLITPEEVAAAFEDLKV